MEQVQNPKQDINLLLNDSPGHREIAVAVQAAWKELGLTTTIKRAGVGAVPRVHRAAAGQVRRRLPARLDRRLRGRDQLPRAVDVRVGQQLDELLQQGARPAGREGACDADNEERYAIYAQIEEILLGEDGAMPIAPIYWYTTSYQERAVVQETFNESLLGQVDLRECRGSRGLGARTQTGREPTLPPGLVHNVRDRVRGRPPMTKFIIRRLFWTIPVILLVILMTFVMMRQIKGNPFRTSERAIPAEIQANLERKFGLDDPWYDAVRELRQGRRHLRPRPVARAAQPGRERHRRNALPGLAGARRARLPVRDRLRHPAGGDVGAEARTPGCDYTAMFISNVGFAVPSFLVATLLIYFFALQWGNLGVPTSGWDTWQSKILPSIALGLGAGRVLRAPRARHDARDDAAGLHPHGPRQGPALPACDHGCTPCATR